MSCITITFGDVAENHAGMQKIGEMREEGLSLEELEILRDVFEHRGKTCKIISLDREDYGIPAYLLVVRNAIDNAAELQDELTNLEWDKKAWMRGRVVNKKMRHNLVFADREQEPDYESKKGRIVNFNAVPRLSNVRRDLEDIVGTGLVAEGNFYYDVDKCGIGWHGDSERRIVIGVRLGESMPLSFSWYENREPIGDLMTINLHHGDLYAMSDKVVGHDWKRTVGTDSSGKRIALKTLRHCAGRMYV